MPILYRTLREKTRTRPERGEIPMSKKKYVRINKSESEEAEKEEKKITLPEGFHKALVPALDVLIGDPDILEPDEDTPPKAEELLIPMQYIDCVSAFVDEVSSRGEAAAMLLDSFAYYLGEIHDSGLDYYEYENGMRLRFVEQADLNFDDRADRNKASANALATAHYYSQLRDNDVAILTGQDEMAAMAYSRGFDVAHVNMETYTGRRLLKMPEGAYADWFSKGYLTEAQFAEFFPDEKPLLLNEFVEFELDEATAASVCTTGHRFEWSAKIGRFRIIDKERCLQQLQYIDELPPFIKLKSAGQAMYAEALLAPVDEIAMVISPSPAGTGKTFLATAIGLWLTATKNPRFKRIFVCPRDPELGRQIGYVPGEEWDKTLVLIMPILDNIRAYVALKGDKGEDGKEMSYEGIVKEGDRLLDKHFELAPLVHMGGRNIADSWIMYDEMQDTERFQMRQLMGRIGKGSKMVITGDPTQINNKHVNEFSNGLNMSATKMAGCELAAIISMEEEEIERCEAAKQVVLRCSRKRRARKKTRPAQKAA